MDSNETKSVGHYLRQIRESRGLSLDDAAQVTRIGKNYLTAIEEEMFEKLPNPAYIKGFLRVYAGYLGLQGDDVVALYEKGTSAHSSQPPETARQAGVIRGAAHKSRGLGRWLVPGVLLGLIILFAAIGQRKGEPEKQADVPVSHPRAETAQAPVQPVRSSAKIPQETPSIAPVQTREAVTGEGPATPTKGIILRLKVNQDGGLNMTIDDTISQHYDLKAGDVIEWKAEKMFTLDLGNAGGVEAEFNGKPLKPFGETGKSAHVDLKADGG